MRRLLARLLPARSQGAQPLLEEILYLSSRTLSLDELLTLFPERISSALQLASFHILLREKNGYILQSASAEAEVTFAASGSVVARMKRDRKPALFIPDGAAGDQADGWQLLAEPEELAALALLDAQVLLPARGPYGADGLRDSLKAQRSRLLERRAAFSA